MRADVVAIDVGNAPADRRTAGEIVSMGRGVDGIIFDGRSHIEARLLEAKRQSACPGEKRSSPIGFGGMVRLRVRIPFYR